MLRCFYLLWWQYLIQSVFSIQPLLCEAAGRWSIWRLLETKQRRWLQQQLGCSMTQLQATTGKMSKETRARKMHCGDLKTNVSSIEWLGLWIITFSISWFFYLAMRIMILIGSFATVIRNMANGGPNARKAHPKNSRSAMFLNWYYPMISI